jgi:hypothetical protein
MEMKLSEVRSSLAWKLLALALAWAFAGPHPAVAQEESPVIVYGDGMGPTGVPVLTGEDMDRLIEERRDLVERGSALGEEYDQADSVRRQLTEPRAGSGRSAPE